MPARILVIEDNAANLELVRYLLAHAGHEVLPVTDGQQGVEAALAQSPDLVICDLRMPVLDGYKVLHLLRSQEATRGVPVVAVTAFSMPEDRHKVTVAGFDGYLTKPIEPNLFVAQVEQYLPAALRTGLT